MTDLRSASVAETARLVADGTLTARQVTDAAIERITLLNPRLNAISQRVDDRARAEADTRDAHQVAGGDLGPLHGVPLVIKEELAVEGLVTTFGGDGNSVPASADSEVVRRLRAAGAVVVATSAMPEFGAFPYTESVSRGTTRNPWNTKRSPGGSSGGTAVAVVSGMVPAGMGGDGGGSIRIPSACCGLFGLKPQRGRVTSAPHEHLWFALGTAGPLTRTVLDSALVYDVIRGSLPATRGTPGRRARSPTPLGASPAGCGSAGRPSRSPSASSPTRCTSGPSRTPRGCSPTSVTTSARSTRSTRTRPRRSCRSSSVGSAPRPT